MGTWIYLQCDSHTSPISSDGEVGQRLNDLPDIRRHIKNRKLYRSMGEQGLMLDAQGDHYAVNAFRFLNIHPDCDVSICDEYGNTHPIDPSEEKAMSSTCPSKVVTKCETSKFESPTFEQELTDLLNKHHIDVKTKTADWILATHIIVMLNSVKDLNDARRGWGHIPLGYDEHNNISED